MTLNELKDIVTDVVNEVLALSALEVEFLAFSDKNKQLVRQAALSINGRASAFRPDDSCTLPPDVLVVDSIPGALLPRLALGLFDDQMSRGIFKLLRHGSPVLVLKQEDVSHVSQKGILALIDSYLGVLEAYGVIFLNRAGRENPHQTGVPAPRHVFRGNVLSRQALLEHGSSGVITLGSSVLITDLARDTAREAGIQIRRESGERE